MAPDAPALAPDSTTTWPPVATLLPDRMLTEPALRPLPVCSDKLPLKLDDAEPVEIDAAPLVPADDEAVVIVKPPD
jgi:hypothetical protein